MMKNRAGGTTKKQIIFPMTHDGRFRYKINQCTITPEGMLFRY